MSRVHALLALWIATTATSIAACSSTTDPATTAASLPTRGFSAATIAPESTPATTNADSPSTEAGATSPRAPVVERPELAAFVRRSWRVVAYKTAGGEEPVSGDYPNAIVFILNTNGMGTVSTHGCVSATFPVTFSDDSTFVVGDHIGTLSACANPFDQGQHVDAALIEGATVRWSIGNDGRLTLTPTATTDTAVVYD